MVGLTSSFTTKRDVLFVRLGGELDHHAASRLKEEIVQQIKENKIKNLVVNLERLQFMDSSGIGVMLGRYNQIKALHGKMILCCVPPMIKKIFEMSGIFKIMTLEASEEDALNSIGEEVV